MIMKYDKNKVTTMNLSIFIFATWLNYLKLTVFETKWKSIVEQLLVVRDVFI